jgi:dTDP-4-dehydrorhamnose reductase
LKSVLVTGAGGMLGEKIVDFFSKFSEYKIFALNRNDEHPRNEKVTWENVDLNNKVRLGNLLKKLNPDIIIHCAANVNLDLSEIDSSDAIYLHSNIINEFKSSSPNSTFVYISTDSIFDGEKGNYNEKDLPNPLNKYAFSKLEGERKVAKLFKDHLIIRTNIYGYHSNNKNSLAKWAITSLENGELINGFENVIFNPVYTLQLATIIEELLKSEFRGLINVGCDEVISKFSFLKLIAKRFNFNEDLIVKSHFDISKFKAPRPLNTSIDNSLVKCIINKNISLVEGILMLYNDLTN